MEEKKQNPLPIPFPDDMDDYKAKWIFLLWLLLRARNYKQIHEKWDSFAQEIQGRNRFFPKSEILDIINTYQKNFEFTVPESTLLYRARETTWDKTSIYKLMEKSFNLSSKKEGNSWLDALSEAVWEDAVAISYLFNHEVVTDFEKHLNTMLESNYPFLGLAQKDCDAPPAEHASAARANPEGIAYLYAAESIDTAIMEVRPSLKSFVNIAEVETTRPLRLFNLCDTPQVNSKKPSATELAFEFEFLSKEFSKLSKNKKEDYLPTQCICEFLKANGFDGIRYQSSLCKSGANIALFDVSRDSRGYKIKSSQLVVIQEATLGYSAFDLSETQHLINIYELI